MQQASPTDPLLAHDALISQSSPAVPKPQDPSRTTSDPKPPAATMEENPCPICKRGLLTSEKAVESFSTTDEFRSGNFAISPDGSTIACACSEGIVALYCLRCGQEVGRWNGRRLLLLCVAFSPDGALIASGGNDKTVTIRDAKNRSQDEDDTAVLHTITDHKVDVRCDVAFSPTQQQIASSDSSGLVLLHALPRQGHNELVLLYRFSTRKYTPSLGYSPNGSQLVICHHGGFHKLDLATNKLFVLNNDRPSSCMAFSPTGKLVATGVFASNCCLQAEGCSKP